jgi:hypothetical protein
MAKGYGKGYGVFTQVGQATTTGGSGLTTGSTSTGLLGSSTGRYLIIGAVGVGAFLYLRRK